MMIRLKVLEALGFYRPVDYLHKRFELLGARLESPIEKIFWSAAYFELSKHGILTPQFATGQYRLDFAYLVEDRCYAIELDGYDYHSQPQQMNKDYRRRRDLQAQGWVVIQFTGSEVYGDVQGCIRTVKRIVANDEGRA